MRSETDIMSQGSLSHQTLIDCLFTELQSPAAEYSDLLNSLLLVTLCNIAIECYTNVKCLNVPNRKKHANNQMKFEMKNVFI